MFIRPLQHVRLLQRLQIVPQRLHSQIAIYRHYAILLDSNRTALQTKTAPSCLIYLRHYANQQIQYKEQTERPLKQGLEHVMTKLESAYQLNGFIGVEQWDPLMNVLQSDANLSLTQEQGLFLLNVIGCEMPALAADQRIANFEYLWQYLEQHHQITKDHYHSLLQMLQYNRAPLSDYKVFLQEYAKVNGSVKEILSQLLAVSGANGNVKQATAILAEMRSSQIALTEHDFSCLILAHARAKDMNGLQTVLDSMNATGLSISTETQSTLVVAYIENGNETKASDIVEEYREQFHNHEILKMVQSVKTCEEISHDFVRKIMKSFKADYVAGMDVPLALRRICVELLYNNKLDYAVCIVDMLSTPIFQENENIDTYGVFLIHALFRANCEVEKIIDFAIRLEETNKNTRALHVSAEIALKRNPPMALDIFEALAKREQPLRPHYFWPLMLYNFRRHSEAGIIRTLKIMQKFGVECNVHTIMEYVIPKLSIILTAPQMALKQLEDAGIKTSLLLPTIVSHMLQQNKWFDIVAVIEPYTTKINAFELVTPLCSAAVNVRATKRYHEFAKLLKVLSDKNIDQKQDFVGQFLVELLKYNTRMRSDLYSLQLFLKEMHKIGLNISPAAATKLQNLLNQPDEDQQTSETMTSINKKLIEMTRSRLNLANSNEDDSAMESSFIKHPRDMTYEELECHLVELESKQMNTRGVLRRLLQVCVRDNRLQRALEIKKKCDQFNVHTSPGMLASTFEMYTKMENLTDAKEILERLQRTFPGFLIDEHKFVDYASLLVKCGQLEDAKNLLEERSLKHRIVGGDYLLKNVWNLLTNVAHLAASDENIPNERNLTRETFAFIQSLGYCKTHNTILGPIVRERLLRGDLPTAIKEFTQLAEQYKHTPLQFELLSLVVRVCNGNDELTKKYNCKVEEAQQILADITDIVTKIHGQINMNSALLLAFAESGSDNQLRRLLLTPEFRINEDLLLRNCEHLGQEGAVQTLLRLVRGARGLNRMVNEQNIYNILLNNFIKANNYEAAINLYEKLEEDDELNVSQEFLRNLVNLLRTNNIEIPSNIALRAHII